MGWVRGVVADDGRDPALWEGCEGLPRPSGRCASAPTGPYPGAGNEQRTASSRCRQTLVARFTSWSQGTIQRPSLTLGGIAVGRLDDGALALEEWNRQGPARYYFLLRQLGIRGPADEVAPSASPDQLTRFLAPSTNTSKTRRGDGWTVVVWRSPRPVLHPENEGGLLRMAPWDVGGSALPGSDVRLGCSAVQSARPTGPNESWLDHGRKFSTNMPFSNPHRKPSRSPGCRPAVGGSGSAWRIGDAMLGGNPLISGLICTTARPPPQELGSRFTVMRFRQTQSCCNAVSPAAPLPMTGRSKGERMEPHYLPQTCRRPVERARRTMAHMVSPCHCLIPSAGEEVHRHLA